MPRLPPPPASGCSAMRKSGSSMMVAKAASNGRTSAPDRRMPARVSCAMRRKASRSALASCWRSTRRWPTGASRSRAVSSLSTSLSCTM
eukprot:12222147-Heterocapsa_arctica.AAC.1